MPHTPRRRTAGARRFAPAILALLLAVALGAGAARAPAAAGADARAATSLTFSATPDVVENGGSTTLSGRLESAGEPVGGAEVSIERSLDGDAWSELARLATDAGGGFSLPAAPEAGSGRTLFRCTYSGSDVLQPSAAELAVGVRAELGAPAVPLRVGRGSPFETSGLLRPQHLAGSAAVTISCYRLEKGEWVLRQTAAAVVSDEGAASRFAASLSLPAAGTWRLRAAHADDAHAATESSWSTNVAVGATRDAPVWDRDGITTIPERMAFRRDARQLVVVSGAWLGARTGRLRVYDYRDGDWVKSFSAPVRLGRRGLTDGARRRAGTLTTPTGIWHLPGFAFGTHAAPPSGLRLRYRHITGRSWWSSERNATYNTWVETSRSVYGEHLADYPVEYEFAVSTGYNALPNRRVYGRGAGIFLHVFGRSYTAGCVSMARADMLRLLRRLDPSQRPACAIGTLRAGTPTCLAAY